MAGRSLYTRPGRGYARPCSRPRPPGTPAPSAAPDRSRGLALDPWRLGAVGEKHLGAPSGSCADRILGSAGIHLLSCDEPAGRGPARDSAADLHQGDARAGVNLLRHAVRPQTRPPVGSAPENGGGGGIRTPGELSPTSDFKSGALNHSATPPTKCSQVASWPNKVNRLRGYIAIPQPTGAWQPVVFVSEPRLAIPNQSSMSFPESIGLATGDPKVEVGHHFARRPGSITSRHSAGKQASRRFLRLRWLGLTYSAGPPYPPWPPREGQESTRNPERSCL